MSWPYVPIGVPTAVLTERVTAFGNVDQTSVIITVILSFGGLAWAIFFYMWCSPSGAAVRGHLFVENVKGRLRKYAVVKKLQLVGVGITS